MTDQDFYRERPRGGAEDDNDWDWDYYYEYRFVPYSPYRKNDYDRNYYRNSNDRDDNNNYETYPYAGYHRGRYTGVGPRGYRRSDERMQEEINDRLTWHGAIDATDMEVDVQDGIVTLTGSVSNRREKRLAEDIAESVSGVRDVDNQLRIRHRGQSWGSHETNQDIRVGMEVIGSDDKHVGEVKKVRSDDFLVDRPMARDVYVPFSACEVIEGQIRLNVRANQVEEQGWEMPELVDTSKKKR